MSAAKQYKAVPGSRLKDEDAEVIGPVVDRLTKKNGAATAKDLLEAARSPRSALHKYFEWDDQKAAEAHRLARAGQLIRSIQIVVVTKEAPVETRAFHVTTQDERKGYRPAAQVFASENLSDQVIKNALRELSGWKARYQQYRKAARLAPVFTAIDGALEERADETPLAAE